MKSFWFGLLLFQSQAMAGAPPADEPLFRTSATWTPPLASDSVASKVEGDVEFAKLSWFFPNRVRVSKVEIESCDAPFNDGVDIHVDFERRHLFIEGGRKSLTADLGFISQEGESIRSLTINFRHNSPLCLKDVRILGTDGKVLAGKPKAPISATVPVVASGLFDSRFETVWKSESSAPPGAFQPVMLQFPSLQVIQKLRVWNGDQSSSVAFRDKGRVEKLSLKTETGPAEVIELKDSTGVQEFKMREDFRGSQLQIQALSAKPGSRDSLPSLSEIRFAGPEGVVHVSAEPSRSGIEKENRRIFGENGLASALDHELRSGEGRESWSFRFRANGEFYVRGFSDEWRTARSFFAVGSFEAESLPKTKDKNPRSQIRLRLSGFRLVSPNASDADVCDLACGAEEARSKLPVRDVLVLESFGKGSYYVRNRSEIFARDLAFDDLKARITSLKE